MAESTHPKAKDSHGGQEQAELVAHARSEALPPIDPTYTERHIIKAFAAVQGFRNVAAAKIFRFVFLAVSAFPITLLCDSTYSTTTTNTVFR